MKKLAMVMMLMGLGASNAYAIAPCGQVCRGANEPCSLPCFLDNHFTTTCDQVFGGRCVPVAAQDTTDALAASEGEADAVCQTEIDVVPVVAEWIQASVAAANNVVSAFDAVLG